jgi:heme/copper-type cytochrome/quinol oxidase subunit 2
LWHAIGVRATLLLVACSVGSLISATPSAQLGVKTMAQDDLRRRVTVTVRDSGFDPPRLEVRHNDLVEITVVAEGGPHAFTIDAYRIAKRATPGHPSTLEFRADRVGSFPFYCTLASANGSSHDERGELVVGR